VQLGAFSGAERQAKAQALQRKVKEKAGMTAEIDISSNKEIYKVIVVGFPDKEAATKALPGLKQKLGISEGFVKAL
jgi:cell division septation protein DedD